MAHAGERFLGYPPNPGWRRHAVAAPSIGGTSRTTNVQRTSNYSMTVNTLASARAVVQNFEVMRALEG